jgi:hypothetical protein
MAGDASFPGTAMTRGFAAALAAALFLRAP